MPLTPVPLVLVPFTPTAELLAVVVQPYTPDPTALVVPSTPGTPSLVAAPLMAPPNELLVIVKQEPELLQELLSGNVIACASDEIAIADNVDAARRIPDRFLMTEILSSVRSASPRRERRG
jgi:hypothetical protein